MRTQEFKDSQGNVIWRGKLRAWNRGPRAFRWSDPIDRRFIKDLAVVAGLAGFPVLAYLVFLIAYLHR